MGEILQKKYRFTEACIRLEKGKGLYSDSKISTAEEAVRLLQGELSGYDREVLCVVNLNTRLRPVNFHVVSVGDISQSIAYIPNILKTGILSNSSSFILLHNHPSGDVTPSGQDIQLTRRVVEAGKILGITCLDHVIVGGGNGTFCSIRETGCVDFEGENISLTAAEIFRVGEDKDQPERRKMTGKEYAALRKEQLKEITDRLEAGVKEYMTNDVNFKKVLETMSKFHHYSANNVLLIAMQMPEATHVASYGTWQRKFKRQVMKGQKGLSIIAPAPQKEKRMREITDPKTGQAVLDADGKPKMEEIEMMVPRFKVEKVFDLSQTTGEPLPELNVPELTGNSENYKAFMEAMHKVSPVPIRFDDVEGGAKGYYSNEAKEIVIRFGMSENQTMKTAVHEVSHARLHDRDFMKEEGIEKNQQTRELEAEAIAYTVMFHYNLDTSDYSIPYLAGWSGSQDTKALKTSMDTIRKTASEIIDEVDAFMAERLKERETSRGAESIVDQGAKQEINHETTSETVHKTEQKAAEKMISPDIRTEKRDAVEKTAIEKMIADRKPSVLENLKEHQKEIREKEKERSRKAVSKKKGEQEL